VAGQAGAATAANDTIREAGGALVGSLARAMPAEIPSRPRAGPY